MYYYAYIMFKLQVLNKIPQIPFQFFKKNLNHLHSLKFPHINRIINATLWSKQIKIFICLFLITAISVNCIYEVLNNKNDLQHLNYKIMADPYNSHLHEELAQQYLKINETISEKEYFLADELSRKSMAERQNVLGISSSPWQAWLKIKSQKAKIETEIIYWDEVKSSLPDYQYAYLKLAYDYFLLNDYDKSRNYLNQAVQRNPVDENTLNLTKILNSIEN